MGNKIRYAIIIAASWFGLAYLFAALEWTMPLDYDGDTYVILKIVLLSVAFGLFGVAYFFGFKKIKPNIKA